MKIYGLFDNFATSFEVMREQLVLDAYDIECDFVKCDEMTVGVKGGRGYIRCAEVNHFNRLLGLFAQYYKGEDFEIKEKVNFKTLALMLDISFRGPIQIEGIKEYFRYLAVMGYNQIWFYAEDMYEMPEKYKHFGYMRGRYSTAELKELDDYAYSIGIEIVPCIQTLGHMQHYLRWEEASPYRENSFCLLPGDEKTYEFIKDMLVWASKPFRSKRIHVGLDETHGLGLGASLKRDGYREPIDIFVEHTKKVAEMCEELGLRPMMWNDMIFCFASKKHEKYAKDTELPQYIIDAMPKNMDLVYWNYEDETCGKTYIEKNRAIGNPVIFAGGVWIFGGALPDNKWSEFFHERALADCKACGLDEVCMTVWSYGSTIYQTSLLEAARYAEHAFCDTADKLPERFEFLTGASFEAFYDMSDFHAQYKEGKIDYDSMPYDERFYGDKFMHQDVMMGLYDEKLFREPRSEHYRRMADQYAGYVAKQDEWCWLYEYCYALFKMLSIKCYVAERLVPAYKADDKATLRIILEEKLPALEAAWAEIYECHMYHKDNYLRPFGGEQMDEIYGTHIMRTKYAIRRIGQYLSGLVESLPELEEPRYDEGASAWGWGFGNLTQI